VKLARGRAEPRLQQQLHAFHVDRIAGPQHRHPLHRTAVDVHPAHAVGHLQPQAAPIHADLRQQSWHRREQELR